ncbi:Os08g0466800 [Oryza sativa Japonica Group]|uniref:Os08g0466800 protein n=3 Tax=Oryza sativa subsp. japonica TaxID=39947 RepID=A0A0P0XGP7_ORYSJ|nr:Os08g0466800 [Oryza sativa Japonica Group]
MDMETAQERETRAWRWPLDTMACGLGDTGRFLFEWVPQLRCFGLGVVGVGAAGDPIPHGHGHTPHGRELELELFFPKCMESPASEAVVTGLPAHQDTMVMYDEFDELLQSFRDGNEEQQLVGFDSSCFLNEKNSDVTCFLDYDGDDLPLALSSVSPMEPLDNTVGQPQAELEHPPSSASSHGNVGPHASDTGASADKDCSSKRPATPEGNETASSKRSRTTAAPPPLSGAGTSVVYPFAVVKPSGLDGGATLADINARILTRPPRPVRHPVGEFACAPRAAAGGDRPAPSGKTVAGFTRLHTAGSGTITIIRTKG